MKQPHECKAGQPVTLVGFTGQSVRLNGQKAYLDSPKPDEHGLFTAHIVLKEATKSKDAETRVVKGAEARFQVIEGEKPPRNFEWFFTAKDYRYAIQRSGEQPQQLD